jgi:hypothetical protein
MDKFPEEVTVVKQMVSKAGLRGVVQGGEAATHKSRGRRRRRGRIDKNFSLLRR